MRDYEEKSYYEIQLDNKQLILVFFAGMTVCVLIFVLGVMIGKGKKEAEMAAMKNEATTTAATSPDVTPPQEIQPAANAEDRQKGKNRKGEKEGGDEKSSDEYAFYNLDKTDAQQPLTKEPVPDTTEKKATKKEVDKTQQDLKAKKESEVKKVEETPKVAKESTKQEPVVEAVRTSLPDTTEDAKEEVTTAMTTDENGRYTVQVMATASKNKADEQLQFLKAKGYTAFMHTDQIQGGSVYKVRVGKFSDPSVAKKTATRIKQDLKLETWVAVLD